MGTVPIGTGAFLMIHSRVAWMLRPVERSMTVSAPQRIAHTIFSTSSSTEEVTAELPILALILVRKLRPLAMVDVAGDDGASARDLAAHVFGRDEQRQRGPETLAVGLRGLRAVEHGL